MAGRGMPASGKRGRARDNDVREAVKSDGKLGGYELPEDVLGSDPKTGEQIEWHTQTIRWWNNWRAAPQGTRMLTDVDWTSCSTPPSCTTRCGRTVGGTSPLRSDSAWRSSGPPPRTAPVSSSRSRFPKRSPAGKRGNDATVTVLEARRDRWGV